MALHIINGKLALPDQLGDWRFLTLYRDGENLFYSVEPEVIETPAGADEYAVIIGSDANKYKVSLYTEGDSSVAVDQTPTEDAAHPTVYLLLGGFQYPMEVWVEGGAAYADLGAGIPLNDTSPVVLVTGTWRRRRAGKHRSSFIAA